MTALLLNFRVLANGVQDAELFLRWWLALWLVVLYVTGVAWWCRGALPRGRR